MTVLKRYTKRLTPVVMAIALMTAVATPASAATFTDISMQLSNPVPGATGVTASFTLSNQSTAQTIRCVTVDFNTQASSGGSTPTGSTAASATIGGNLVDFTGWSSTGSTAGQARSTNATGATPSAGTGRTITVSNLTNGTTADTTYYAIVKTYTNDTCTTPTDGQDAGVVAYVYTNQTTVSVIVDPTLTFTVNGRGTACNSQSTSNFQTGSSGTAVSLGRINGSTAGGGAQDLAVTTNARGGFTVYSKTPGTTPHSLRSGSHSINDVSGSNGTPGAAPSAGSEGFGYTVGGAQRPSQFNANEFAALTSTYAPVMSAASGTQTGASCVGYAAAASSTTEAGLYTTNVQYTAVPVF